MLYALSAWTLLVWAARLRNIAQDGGSALSVVVAAGLCALAVAVAMAARRGGRPSWPVTALVVATVVVWAVRVPAIVADADHGLAFKAVHAGLALVSWGLAAGAWRRRGRRVSSPMAA